MFFGNRILSGIELKMFPLSFSEYYSYHRGDRSKAFNDYMMYGGMPYLLQETEPMQQAEYLRTITETVVTDDIIERYGKPVIPLPVHITVQVEAHSLDDDVLSYVRESLHKINKPSQTTNHK